MSGGCCWWPDSSPPMSCPPGHTQQWGGAAGGSHTMTCMGQSTGKRRWSPGYSIRWVIPDRMGKSLILVIAWHCNFSLYKPTAKKHYADSMYGSQFGVFLDATVDVQVSDNYIYPHISRPLSPPTDWPCRGGGSRRGPVCWHTSQWQLYLSTHRWWIGVTAEQNNYIFIINGSGVVNTDESKNWVTFVHARYAFVLSWIVMVPTAKNAFWLVWSFDRSAIFSHIGVTKMPANMKLGQLELL